ncbi:Hypothetical predicted protein, partial [Mytilus galloprovincialis]
KLIPKSWYDYQEICLKRGYHVLYNRDIKGGANVDQSVWTPIFRSHTVVTGKPLGKDMCLALSTTGSHHFTVRQCSSEFPFICSRIQLSNANNLVIEFSTSTYELFKTLLHQLLAKSTSYKPKTTEGVDYQNAIVDSCIKVYNRLKDGSMGRTLKFVINLYHTSSRVVVNGNRVDLFVSDIYGDLCAKLSTHYEDLSVINKGIFDTIDLTSISKTKEQQTNNDIQKDNNLGLPYCQTSSSNLVENPCLTNGPPKALTMVTSCNESTGTSSDSAQDSITIVKNNSVSAIQDSIHVHLCICPLCNQEAGENTIECGQCEEWIHFSCGNINNPSSMGDKVYVCPVCSDNLLYAPRQSPDKMSSHSNDINSENSKTYAINRKRSVSDSF